MVMHIDHFLQSLSAHIDLGHAKRNQACRFGGVVGQSFGRCMHDQIVP